MASLQIGTKGRDFTAEELMGRRIRIEGPVPKKQTPPTGYTLMVIADDEEVNNVTSIVLTLEPDAIIEAKLTLYRFDQTRRGEAVPTEEVTLRDNIEMSFSAIVSEVH